MPMHADIAGVRRLRADVARLAAGDDILKGIDGAIKTELRDEFARGVGPYGTWQPTVRGKQPLESRKLPFAFRSGIQLGRGLAFVGQSKRDFLKAHQEGHEFPARKVGAHERFLTFKSGKLIKNARALNKRGEATRGVHQTFARAHEIKTRTLPARPIVPEGSTLPPSWEEAVDRGAQNGFQRWADKVQR